MRYSLKKPARWSSAIYKGQRRPWVLSPKSLDYPRCACNVDGWWVVGGGGVLPGHQIKPQDAIGIRIRVVINKFCPDKTVVDASDPHRFLNRCFLLVIEGKRDRKHIVDQDGMSTHGAEPEPRP